MSCGCNKKNKKLLSWREFCECQLEQSQNEGIKSWIGNALGYNMDPVAWPDFVTHYKNAQKQGNKEEADRIFQLCYKAHGEKCNQLVSSQQGYYNPGSSGLHSSMAVPGRASSWDN